MCVYCFGQDLKKKKTHGFFLSMQGTSLGTHIFWGIIGSHCSFSPFLKRLIVTALFVLEHLDHEKLLEFVVQLCSNYSAMLSASFDRLSPIEANSASLSSLI